MPSSAIHRAAARGGASRPVAVVTVVLAALLATLVPQAEPARAADVPARRLSGPDRYATAAAVADEWEPGVDRAFLATGTDFPDALATVPVAAMAGDPVLLVERDRIPAATAAALDRLAPGAITVVGGPAVVSEAVLDQAAEHTTGPVDRVAGATRYDTAAAITRRFVAPSVPVVHVASGTGFADAVAGGPAAATQGGPLLLVQPDGLPEATARELDRLAPERIVVLGGPAAVSAGVEAALGEHAPVVDRLAGRDRYGTSAAVVHDAFPGGRDRVYVATGTAFPDALVGGVLAGSQQVPLVTVPTTCVTEPVREQVDRVVPGELVLLGGPAALSEDVAGLAPCEDLPPGVRVTTVERGLDVPWDLVFTPDDRVFLTERDTGRVLERVGPGDLREVVSFPVDNGHEGGLVGLAVSPDYAVDGRLYAAYVAIDQMLVVSFRVDGAPRVRTVVSGLPDGGPDNISHFAGRVDFGPDGMLYVSVGDVRDRDAAQDPASLAGKILRYTPEGDVPDDNPFEGSPVWALGFRDPQGMAWAADGTMYASEFGPNEDDEVNVIEPGSNHGWPIHTGSDGGDPAYADPIVVKQPPEASWSGMSVLTDGAIPAWEGDLFVAALRGTRLWRIDLEAGEVVGTEPLLVGTWGRMRHVTQAPDGSLWIITSNHDDNGSPVTGDDVILRVGPA